MTTTDRMMQDSLREALIDIADGDLTTDGSIDVAVGGADIATFEEAGVMTNNAGLVIRTTDGTEFQVTIVRSR